MTEELCIAVCRYEEPSEDFSILIFGKGAHRQKALLPVHALKRLGSRFVYHIASQRSCLCAGEQVEHSSAVTRITSARAFYIGITSRVPLLRPLEHLHALFVAQLAQ